MKTLLWPKDATSRWNTELLALKHLLRTEYGILQVRSTKDLETLYNAVKNIYHRKSARSGRILQPSALTRAMFQAIEIYRIVNPCLVRDLKLRTRRLVEKILLEYDLEIKAAPIFTLQDFFELAHFMWKAKGVQKGSTFKIRAAATAMVVAACTGNRWIDTMRLRWEDVRIFEQNNVFVQFRLRILKNNIEKIGPAYNSIKLNEEPQFCAVRLLKRWWDFSGRNQHGFIFATKERALQTNAVFCFIPKLAKQAGWTRLPGKHSMRNSLVKFMFQQNFSLDEIRRQFNWAVNSQMPIRYLRNHMDQDDRSLASRLSRFSRL